MSPVVKYILSATLPLGFKTALYYSIFRLRSIQATLLNCIVIAGAPILLSVIPLPLPNFLQIILSIGAAIYLCSQYTEVELYPDGIFIPLGVELTSLLVVNYISLPLIV